MRTLDLKEAAAFLKMTPEGLRRKVCIGEIPGAKNQENVGYFLRMTLRIIYAHFILWSLKERRVSL